MQHNTKLLRDHSIWSGLVLSVWRYYEKLIIASICVALGVVLSTTSIPVGPARIFPFQHMINVILAVVVGARFSVGAAFSTSCLRNVLALGSPLAFPGSMIGAWLSAYLYKKYKRSMGGGSRRNHWYRPYRCSCELSYSQFLVR